MDIITNVSLNAFFFFQRDFSSDKIIAAVIVKGVKQDGVPTGDFCHVTGATDVLDKDQNTKLDIL